MKTGRNKTRLRLLIAAGTLLISLSLLPSCHHKADSEDDTFRESTIDDPARHYRKTVEKDKKDSLNHKDTNRVKENVTY